MNQMSNLKQERETKRPNMLFMTTKCTKSQAGLFIPFDLEEPAINSINSRDMPINGSKGKFIHEVKENRRKSKKSFKSFLGSFSGKGDQKEKSCAPKNILEGEIHSIDEKSEIHESCEEFLDKSHLLSSRV